MRNHDGRIWLRRVMVAAGVALALWSILATSGWGGCLGWLGELFANFPVCPVVAAGLSLLIFVRWSGRVAIAFGGVALAVVVSLTLAAKPRLVAGSAGGKTLKIATWNACLGKLNPVLATKWIEASEPDIIVFTEITRPLREAFAASLGARYPYFQGTPRDGAGGLAAFSKVPISNWKRCGNSAQQAAFDLEWPGGPTCRLFVSHPPAPTTWGRYDQRNRVFGNLAALVAQERRPAMVVGDLNSTWASKDFRAFCRATGMLPATNFLPSWNASLPRVFQIAIDHVLVNPADFMAVSAAAGGSGCGSDHLPVLAKIELRRSPLAITH